jgi:EPS-associated MarR family transcriptional regulator
LRVDDDARYRIMRLIEAQPDISQRQLARELGISLGGVNYCLNALIERGLVTMDRFRASENKLAYAYALTPKGHLREDAPHARVSGAEDGRIREAARRDRERPRRAGRSVV